MAAIGREVTISLILVGFVLYSVLDVGAAETFRCPSLPLGHYPFLYCPSPQDPPNHTRCCSEGCCDGRGEHHCPSDDYNKDFYCPRPGDQSGLETFCCKAGDNSDACCGPTALAIWVLPVIGVCCGLVLLCVSCVVCCCCACCPLYRRRQQYVVIKSW
ncbi:uncharacterized protein LOC106176670 isoform X1 [Lingula anatina]|uniref:Uncharacterized protein LOC106176670 isoform X1 n=1 Tax=Lingula anatina TaxID=7574 RepID=A0A1S3JWC9_LINAN|nr:uncharacterized protein LOC106176670 isoform X1 [Lingula anatina]|eukprot:XP_013414607.1 uncharacterized protein LOC106176670 isoform X1 [Lingula anatina]